MRFVNLLLAFLLLMSVFAGAEPKPESLDAKLSGFVTAFDNLDWPHFQQFFSDDATVFHPAAPNLKRTDSREAFEKAWLGVFDRIKKSSGKSAPPYMDLQPKELRIQYLDDDVALVTFHLDDGDVLGRRTMIWKRTNGEWKIVHIHASNLPKQ